MSTDRTYIRKPQPYRIPENQSDEAKEKYLQRRTRELKAFLLGCFPEDSDTESLQAEVIGRVARSYKLVCFEEKELLLEIEELVALRDLCQMGSNAIYRFKSGLEALRPKLRGLILPNCIKTRLVKFERTGNLPVKTVYHQLIVSSNDGALR